MPLVLPMVWEYFRLRGGAPLVQPVVLSRCKVVQSVAQVFLAVLKYLVGVRPLAPMTSMARN